MYKSIKAKIRLKDDFSDEFPCQLGVRQGENLSPFSSPELIAQVSYSDRPLSVVRLFVCPSVCKLLHFRLLLLKYWANFNQT
jgi:hypothetical protein